MHSFYLNFRKKKTLLDVLVVTLPRIEEAQHSQQLSRPLPNKLAKKKRRIGGVGSIFLSARIRLIDYFIIMTNFLFFVPFFNLTWRTLFPHALGG